MQPCLLILALPAALLGGCTSLDRAAHVATGYASHQLCSATFVSKVDPDGFFREAVDPVGGPVAFLLRQRIDHERGEVSTTLAGLAESRAVYRGTEGCLILAGAPPASPPARLPPAGTSLLPEIAGPAPVESADPTIKAAFDAAFTETPGAPQRATKAMVIVHNGRVIAERYAPGYGVDTPVIGWSATKSVTNALLGILVRQGRLDMEAPAPIAAWADPKDPRRAITPDNLLRMSSGLDIGQSMTSGVSDAFDPSAQMVFAERDMAGYAERFPLNFAPGAGWNYTNGNTLLLSRIVRDKTGGTAQGVLDFAHRELFDKLGMRHVTLELDATGTPIGSSHMLASPRDWARFGLLYLNDGVVGGQRLLPEGWVDYSARLTPHSGTYGYGAGFWTNRGDSDGGRYRINAGIPADAFMARGALGQYVVVIPSQNLVVARFGMAFNRRDDLDMVARVVRDVISTLPRS
jgi:CubicO group peptidase (beta-lactamase class C family)